MQKSHYEIGCENRPLVPAFAMLSTFPAQKPVCSKAILYAKDLTH